MNIAILIPELGGGGAERAATLLGDYYIGKGYNVYYFLADVNIKQRYKVKGRIIQTGIKIDFKENDSFYVVLCKLWRAAGIIRRYKYKYKIDVAVSYMEAFNYINILSWNGEKNIVSVHTVLSERTDLTYPLYKPKMVKFFYGMAQCVVACGEYSKWDLIERYGVPRKKICKIPNAFTKWNDEEENEVWNYGEKVLITVGRLEKVKQHERLIRSFSYVKQHEPLAKLIILGEGSQRNYLESLCREFGIQNSVFLLGFKQNVGYYLKHSTLFVMSSKTEGFPNSMVEAMSYGLPIVSLDSPGGCGEIMGKKVDDEKITKITYKQYGILTPYITGRVYNSQLEEQEILLGKAIVKILQDKNLNRQYRKQSRKRADNYSIKKIMSAWDQLIEK